MTSMCCTQLHTAWPGLFRHIDAFHTSTAPFLLELGRADLWDVQARAMSSAAGGSSTSTVANDDVTAHNLGVLFNLLFFSALMGAVPYATFTASQSGFFDCELWSMHGSADHAQSMHMEARTQRDLNITSCRVIPGMQPYTSRPLVCHPTASASFTAALRPSSQSTW